MHNNQPGPEWGPPPNNPPPPPGWGAPPPSYPPPSYPPPGYGAPAREGRSNRALWIVGLLVGGPILLCVIGFVGCLGWAGYVGINGPDTKAVPGGQIKQDHARKIRDLGLLAADERILWFYSDAFVDPTKGMYFCTDQKVVVYGTDYASVQTGIPYEDIKSASITPGTGVLQASTIVLDLKDGTSVTFPVATEAGNDQRFFDAIEERISPPDVELE